MSINTVVAVAVCLVTVAAMVSITRQLLDPPAARYQGRHRGPGRARARWREHPAAKVVSGSIAGLLAATRTERQAQAYASYAPNLRAPGHLRRLP